MTPPELTRGRVAAMAEAWRGKRVAVLGDLILDRYVWGRANRISPEAPVPVVTVDRAAPQPGGAANVLRNLATLGAKPVAAGLCGHDAAGDELLGLLAELGVDTCGVIRDASRRTTEKTRIIAGNQQVVRVDTEDAGPATDEQRARFVEQLDSADGISAVIIEDYAKGVVTPGLVAAVLDWAGPRGIPVALDPHPSNPLPASGLEVATPNRAEAFALAREYPAEPALPLENDAALLHAAAALRALWNPACLLVTLGAHGMALFEQDAPPLHIPTRARQVFDVSGAGDTVIASYMLARLGGASHAEAAMVSNHAAGVVVAIVGTAPVNLDDLLATFAA